MIHEEAINLLDMAKDGQPIPEDVLTEALFMTGDAACWRDIPCPDVQAFVQDMKRGRLALSAAIYFVVPGQPVGKGRPRASSRGGFVRMYTDAKTTSYEAVISRQAVYAMGSLDVFETPISMRVIAFYGIPVSWSKRKQQLALNGDLIPGKPDLDNVAKAVLDALNGVVYEDDKQVIRLVIEKSYSFEPRIEVYVHEVLK